MTTTMTATRRIKQRWLHDRTKIILWAVFATLIALAYFAMEPNDWFLTILRGVSVGAITFMVASGFSLIFGLMDVLNLAHGELFMLGAYMGWTVYVRPDTAVDIAAPALLIGAGFAMLPIWVQRAPMPGSKASRRALGGLIAVAGALGLVWALPKFPLSIWDSEGFTDTTISNAVALDQGTQVMPPHAVFDGVSPFLGMLVALVAASVFTLGLAFIVAPANRGEIERPTRRPMLLVVGMTVAAVLFHLVNDALTEWMYSLGTTPRFFLAMIVSTLVGFLIGVAIEVLLIRPLYARPIYQLMITLGLGFIIIEVVRMIWGRPEFTMPKPAVFNGRGETCPGEGFGGLFSGCATTEMFGARVRTYNEMFVILVGILVLVSVTLLIKRTRMGMIIRAGVQDPEMVEAMGVNVRRVFTLTFALGVALAALGGVVAAPSIGLSTGMGGLFLLLALIAMAIGGLTSFPGAAVGALIVGIVQQLVIKFGQIGINLPWLEEPFKPSPALVPASVILIMVIVLLVLPGGLLGKSES